MASDPDSHLSPKDLKVKVALGEFLSTQPHETVCPLLTDALARKLLAERAINFLMTHARKYDLDLTNAAPRLDLPASAHWEFSGLPVLQTYLDDPTVSELSLGGGQLRIERNGVREIVPGALPANANEITLALTERLVIRHGFKAEGIHNFSDSDGTRINAILPPVAVDGAMLSIRRTGRNTFDLGRFLGEDLGAKEVKQVLARFRDAQARTIVVGITGTGKTTLVETLINTLDPDQEVIVCEQVLELSTGPRVRRLTVPSQGTSPTPVSLSQLVRAAIRMRPDVIVVGEARGPEVETLLASLSGSATGAITTLHAASAKSAFKKLCMAAQMEGATYRDLPPKLLLEAVAEAFDLYIVLARDPRNGRRFISEISACVGVADGRPLFENVAKANVQGDHLTWSVRLDIDRVITDIRKKRE